MVDDPNPALRAELNAAFDIVNPQVHGLEGFLAAGLSQTSQDAINEHLEIRKHRKDLVVDALRALDTVVAAFNSLKADGYPTPPPQSAAPIEILAEVQMKERDISRAAHIFGSTSDIPVGTQAEIEEAIAGIKASEAAIQDAIAH